MLPINYEVIIVEDGSVGLLRQIVERMDLRELHKTYSSQERNPANNPKNQIKSNTIRIHEWNTTIA